MREDDNGELYWNCGSPEFSNVILLDVDRALRGVPPIVCPHCQTPTHEVVAVVKDGVFREVRALLEAEADRLLGSAAGNANVVVVRDDGTYWPREDWFGLSGAFAEGKVPSVETPPDGRAKTERCESVNIQEVPEHGK